MPTFPPSQSNAAVYRRRRLGVAVVASCAVSLSVLGACNALADPGGEPASAAGILPAASGRSVTARPGDTLWAIAERVYARDGNRDSMPLRDYVDELVELNGGTALQPGDPVVLP